ncbi:bifunctional UDP-3-O-[3-hydroxymyristoyl] N-acetylglucosamine deacetylase/3-hydroxyacyl-ACP dehydratase [Blattabacterium sp. (Blaberus giganteus)]|uniref:bifunctional UDP-3-O-[3-hydroxymyristoyl] N-acetylglucosamine deacetylase/3-hydroxyacyl-ACP dehydratase n=1 Tax=Blattabacterium sp. (Blaberus giganteus) TaxID=1186051 RepID=UPI00025F707D|nr:bifunctional UDP-3-O-[3-hydroxymyristoyl] N-acetylglucosamine deacetylase/3-hydroxyacyl-ACP dehydratase [Blattabacterium sp. (Blaberus giganteus)]AFJ91013.1 bifunctional UDP-3-O-[3-hydroxymyristoyl] N-acetylglucosamine deacetylase/(3R)-hydroxymyristoyl-ACP dehydratase [Blattabacterium sp. (Blaberus giganteus)]
MLEKQKTIAGKISLQGLGLYTKEKVTITFKPAQIHTGFIFIRTDIKEKPCIEAHYSFFIKESIDKGIILEKNGFKIYTTEHVLAALTGMDLDNVIIELDNIEIPIMDGSSKFFVEAIKKVGIIEQSEIRKYYSITKIISYKNKKETGGEIIVLPDSKLEIMTVIDLNYKYTQNAIFKHLYQFQKIASSRIFCLLYKEKKQKKEVDFLKKKFQKMKENSTYSFLHNTFFYQDQQVFKFNEIAEHFLLDIIGFITLLGTKLKGKFIFYNPDNYIIMQFLKELMNKIQIFKKNDIPEFDLKKKPILDIRNIMKILPHKPPFLLVDKIIDLTENSIVGIKNVTMNESFFIGHFPREPIMPGVLQIEAIAQVGGILVLNKLNHPELYSTYFLKIDKVKFKHKIVPGDIIILQVCLLETMKRGIVFMKGKGFVNNKLVVEAEVVAKIVKNYDKF